MVELDLSPRGWLELHVPDQRRKLELPPTEEGAKLLVKILRDAKQPRDKFSQPKGYCRNFPTQSVIDSWIKEDATAKQEAARKAAGEKFNIDLDQLDISL